jgi:hypothetical protein
MSEAFIEFFVLGRIPGTDVTMGYTTSLLIAAVLMVMISLYATLRYRHAVSLRLTNLSQAERIELKTI